LNNKIKNKKGDKQMISSTGNRIKMSISILVILVAVIILPISLAACQKDVVLKEISDKEELQKITVVLDWVPNTNHTGVYVARENLGLATRNR
jgi:ABC-type nitrate/sulfonate/bicarbonate transport system substrate-binding protein